MWETMKEVRLEGKPVGVVFITSDPGGDSLYIGSRSSSQMGRIYDKWEQSKHDPEFDRCIRYEVEYKKPLSKVVADLILDEDWGSRQIFENVLGWFQERGVIVDQFGTFREGAIQTPRETVSPEKSLAWLERQVKPTYQQLVFRGYEQEAQEALGISPKIIPPDWTDQEMEF
jgi:DNA relaxase NicK